MLKTKNKTLLSIRTCTVVDLFILVDIVCLFFKYARNMLCSFFCMWFMTTIVSKTVFWPVQVKCWH